MTHDVNVPDWAADAHRALVVGLPTAKFRRFVANRSSRMPDALKRLGSQLKQSVYSERLEGTLARGIADLPPEKWLKCVQEVHRAVANALDPVNGPRLLSQLTKVDNARASKIWEVLENMEEASGAAANLLHVAEGDIQGEEMDPKLAEIATLTLLAVVAVGVWFARRSSGSRSAPNASADYVAFMRLPSDLRQRAVAALSSTPAPPNWSWTDLWRALGANAEDWFANAARVTDSPVNELHPEPGDPYERESMQDSREEFFRHHEREVVECEAPGISVGDKFLKPAIVKTRTLDSRILLDDLHEVSVRVVRDDSEYFSPSELDRSTWCVEKGLLGAEALRNEFPEEELTRWILQLEDRFACLGERAPVVGPALGERFRPESMRSTDPHAADYPSTVTHVRSRGLCSPGGYAILPAVVDTEGVKAHE